MSNSIAETGMGRKRKSLDDPDDPIIDVVPHKKLHDGRVSETLSEKLLQEYGHGWKQDGNDEIHMIPCVFTKGSSDDRGAKGEREIYETLQGLNKAKSREAKSSYYFSNLKIPGFVFHGQKYDGNEIDFLFVTIHGLLVIECKGVGTQNQATSKYKEACAQLSKRIPALENLLKRFGFDVAMIPIMGVVAFPLLSRCDFKREDGDPEVLFREDLAELKNWLRRKGFVTNNPITFEIYLKIVRKFLGLYHCRGCFSEYKKRGLLDTKKGLERTTSVWYTKEQKAFLKRDRFHNVWISGAAGTGKKFVLKQRLQFLASEICMEMKLSAGEDQFKKPVKPILVITYNRAINLDIGNWVKNNTEAEGSLVRVQTFSVLMGHVLSVLPNPEETEGTEDEEKITYIMRDKSILKKYFSSNFTKVFRKYRHILVDEAQDLPGNWLDMLCMMLNRNKPSSIWVFEDPFQVVRRNITTVTEVPNRFTRHTFSKVVRNPRNVFEAYKKCYESLCEDGSQELAPPSISHHVYGLKPRYFVAEDDDIMLSKLILTIQDLREKKVSYSDMAILTCGYNARLNVQATDRIKTFLLDNGIECQDAEGKYFKKQQPTVTVDSYQRFKGLEEKIIIFCVPSGWTPKDKHVYVALSRALCQVIVIAPKETIKKIDPDDGTT